MFAGKCLSNSSLYYRATGRCLIYFQDSPLLVKRTKKGKRDEYFVS